MPQLSTPLLDTACLADGPPDDGLVAAVDDEVLCRWQSGEMHHACVLERRQVCGTAASPSSRGTTAIETTAAAAALASGGRAAAEPPAVPAAAAAAPPNVPATARSSWEYYVHYVGMNRRLDEWVSADRCVGFQVAAQDSTAPLSPTATEAADSRTRNHKRRLDVVNHMSGSESALDVEREGAQEQVARMKNIHRIVIGAFEVETWCAARGRSRGRAALRALRSALRCAALRRAPS
jgi:hypothetical protein